MKAAIIFCISCLLQLGLATTGAAQDVQGRASFHFHELSLRASLDSLMKWYRVSVVYFDRDVEGQTVSASCTECGLEQAMDTFLSGTSLRWVMMGNQVILKQRPVEEPRPMATISGIVTDSLTGERIADANVVLQDTKDQGGPTLRRWCPTNSFGFYSLRRISPGVHTIIISALGYRGTRVPVVVTAEGSVRHDCGLIQEDITLQEITVEGRRTALTPAEGFSRGIYIRSAPSDQNQYLLDGARIYNPAHFGGVLSTFDAEVLNDVEVVVGGLPPYYGGRIGGILDYSLRDGSRDRLSGSAGTSSLGLNLSLEGPIRSGTTFLASGRRGYPDAAVPFLSNHGTPSRLGSTEFVGKVSHRLSSSNQVFLSAYVGRDSYDNYVEGPGSSLSNNFSWGNSTFNLRWMGIALPALFLHASAVYTRYDFTIDHGLSENGLPPPVVPLSSDYAIEDVSLRAHAEHYYDELHTLRAGVELTKHQMRGSISKFSSQIARMSFQGYSSWELSVYLQDQWKILPSVTAELGGRATSFTSDEGSFSAVDPRFSLLVSLDDQAKVYTSLNSVNQFVHSYRNSGVFLLYPSIFWYPSSERVKPSTALQLTAGVQKGMRDNVYGISAEFFYRVTNNLHEWVTDTTAAQAADLSDLIIFGTGRSYGMEFSLRKRTGDVTGSISYTLSWARSTFAELNGGDPFAPRIDRRHELQVSASYAPDRNWVFGTLCVLASEQSPSFDPNIVGEKRTFPSGATYDVNFIDVNGSRLPGFQRLELTILRRFSFAGIPCQASLRLVNSYGLLDPFDWELRNSSDVRFKWKAGLRELKVFPLFPTFGIMARF